MTRDDPASLGFLTVLEHEQLGLVGGYLILNTAGRPLEFHCTAPVKPNRAQEILFGPTLESYLYGEQIGQALITKSDLLPLAVCTDIERVLSVRPYVSLPVALVVRDVEVSPSEAVATGAASVPGTYWRIDAAHRASDHLTQFALGTNRLAVSAGHIADRDTITASLTEVATFDLGEPFERIREAVEEAHKTNHV
ncbi:MAG: hypothetical protein DWQ37_12265 [Planctomycetota bacterium]|nr:MAG: hypothetical protein DWQ37_12265 [Planctomycetota bacterium]